MLGGCNEVQAWGGALVSVLASSLRASTHGPPHGESAGSSGRHMGTFLLYGEALELVFVIVICLGG